MGKWERRAWRLLGWFVKGVVRCYLLLGVLMYVGCIIIYVHDNLNWPDPPFWHSTWVLVKAQFVGFLFILSTWFGKVWVGLSALWLYWRMWRFIMPYIQTLRESENDE